MRKYLLHCHWLLWQLQLVVIPIMSKCSYERKNGGMYEMDMVWGEAFN